MVMCWIVGLVVSVVVMTMTMFVVEQIASIVVQNVDDSHEHLVVMMVRHHSMSQYQYIGQHDHQYG